MPRVLATVDESAKAWVESRSDSLDISEAEVIRRLIDAGRADESLVESHSESSAVDESDSESAVIHRVDELEARVAALEAGADTPPDSEGAHGGAEAFEGAKDSDPSPEASSGRGEGESVALGDDLPQTVDAADARDVVAAALNVIDVEGPLERSDLVDELGEQHSLGYDMENRDGAWWKRIVSPGIKANGAEHKPGRGWAR